MERRLRLGQINQVERDMLLTKDALDNLYHRFTALADRKKGVMDEEIQTLIEEGKSARAMAD